jgi:hypothetical protein
MTRIRSVAEGIQVEDKGIASPLQRREWVTGGILERVVEGEWSENLFASERSFGSAGDPVKCLSSGFPQKIRLQAKGCLQKVGLPTGEIVIEVLIPVPETPIILPVAGNRFLWR